MSLQPERPLVAVLNHLLAAEGWAVERLRAFAGQSVCIEGGPLRFSLQVDENGRFSQAPGKSGSTVTITLPPDTPLRLLTDRQSLFAAARLSGSADFAETLGFVFRNLRWDAEGDLAGLVGDIPARRLLRLGQQFVAWQAAASRNLAVNVTEYAVEEAGLLVPAREIQAFGLALDALRDDLAKLELRLHKLGG